MKQIFTERFRAKCADITGVALRMLRTVFLRTLPQVYRVSACRHFTIPAPNTQPDVHYNKVMDKCSDFIYLEFTSKQDVHVHWVKYSLIYNLDFLYSDTIIWF